MSNFLNHQMDQLYSWSHYSHHYICELFTFYEWLQRNDQALRFKLVEEFNAFRITLPSLDIAQGRVGRILAIYFGSISLPEFSFAKLECLGICIKIYLFLYFYHISALPLPLSLRIFFCSLTHYQSHSKGDNFHCFQFLPFVVYISKSLKIGSFPDLLQCFFSYVSWFSGAQTLHQSRFHDFHALCKETQLRISIMYS